MYLPQTVANDLKRLSSPSFLSQIAGNGTKKKGDFQMEQQQISAKKLKAMEKVFLPSLSFSESVSIILNH